MTTKRESARDRKLIAGDEKLLAEIVSSFVRHPDDVIVKTERLGGKNVIQVEVNRDDYGRVFGSQGRQIQAIRTVFAFIASREGRQIGVMLLESTRGTKIEPPPFRANLDWESKKLLSLLKRVLKRILALPFSVDETSVQETTNVTIATDPKEHRIIEALRPSLDPIFHAIGKNEGRQLYLEAPEPIPTMTA